MNLKATFVILAASTVMFAFSHRHFGSYPTTALTRESFVLIAESCRTFSRFTNSIANGGWGIDRIINRPRRTASQFN